ncbi:MAG TPA: CoA transferase [Dehalococcoidia bacterium]|nr:CoA transferase [Dehalococcoidia bacterium]
MPDAPASPARRRYRCRDGYLAVDCRTEAQWRGLARAVGRPELAYPGSWQTVQRLAPRGALGRLLESLLREDDAAGWQRRFQTAGVPTARK